MRRMKRNPEAGLAAALKAMAAVLAVAMLAYFAGHSAYMPEARSGMVRGEVPAVSADAPSPQVLGPTWETAPSAKVAEPIATF
jgi:hypothetical protein